MRLSLLIALFACASAAASPTVMLGRPTDTSIAVNVLTDEPRDVRVHYGPAGGDFDEVTDTVRTAPDAPRVIDIAGLRPNTAYAYSLRLRDPDDHAGIWRIDGAFHTQRAKGSTFTFGVQGDSHPERGNMFDATLYMQTLNAVTAERPDLYIMLGDDFSVDTLRVMNAETVRAVYQRQRNWLSTLGRVAPLFLVNGNHEQAALYNLDGTPDNVAVWAQNSRNALFPQPAPDAFYSGDAQPVEHIGLLRDYYAWTWGDALFVVIDPYWHSREPVDNSLGAHEKKRRDRWAITLGDAQYAWLTKTLETSDARYKFVFTHHVGGTGRGGVEEAHLYEWGGKNRRGHDLFAQQRPNWAMPIHALMVKTGVTALFQGHDHLFARQDLDGVAYISCPVPGDSRYGKGFMSDYKSGDLLPCSGYLRITVAPAAVTLRYIRQWLPGDEPDGHKSGEVAYECRLTGGVTP